MDTITVSAPGRIEIGGNHTDHQRGCVLAAAINLFCVCRAAVSGELRITGAGVDEGSFKLARGVMEYLRKRGYAAGSFTAEVKSDVLVGSGLSSSAAFEVAVGRAVSSLFNNGEIPPAELAKAGQYAENAMLGKPSGLMDQTASAEGGLVFIDFGAQEASVKRLNADFGAYGHSVFVTDTKGSHANLTPDYAAITAEMRSVAEFFGKTVLREVFEGDVTANLPAIRAKLGDRAALRALHFFAETKRAEDEAAALEAGDFEGFLRLVNESGDSSFKCLQNAYSLSNPASQGVPVALEVSRRALAGRGACRLHGGGFGGTILAFVPAELAGGYQGALDGVFGVGACRELAVV